MHSHNVPTSASSVALQDRGTREVASTKRARGGGGTGVTDGLFV